MRWGLLYGFVLIALLSHLLLDWTNNYGLRPFFPFNPHWYALDAYREVASSELFIAHRDLSYSLVIGCLDWFGKHLDPG